MITVNEAIELVLREVETEQKQSSQHTYRWMAAKCRKSWDQASLRSVTKRDVQAWIQRRRSEVSPSTLKSELSFLNRCFRAANDAGFDDLISPTRQVRTPKINNRRERTMSVEEEKAIRAQMVPLDFSVMQFALHTGMRRLEQFNLKPEDIRFFEVPREGELPPRLKGIATIRDSKTGVGRQCPLNIVAAHIAKVWISQFAGSDFLFYGQRRTLKRINVGNWYDCRRWRPALEKARLTGTGLCWHALRHTCASRSLQAGARIQDVQQLLGHKSVIQTERYSHWSSESLWPAADALCQPE